MGEERASSGTRRSSGMDQVSGTPRSSGAGRLHGLIGGRRPGRRPCRRGRPVSSLPCRWKPHRGSLASWESGSWRGPGSSRSRPGPARSGRSARRTRATGPVRQRAGTATPGNGSEPPGLRSPPTSASPTTRLKEDRKRKRRKIGKKKEARRQEEGRRPGRLPRRGLRPVRLGQDDFGRTSCRSPFRRRNGRSARPRAATAARAWRRRTSAVTVPAAGSKGSAPR